MKKNLIKPDVWIKIPQYHVFIVIVGKKHSRLYATASLRLGQLDNALFSFLWFAG